MLGEAAAEKSGGKSLKVAWKGRERGWGGSDPSGKGFSPSPSRVKFAFSLSPHPVQGFFLFFSASHGVFTPYGDF